MKPMEANEFASLIFGIALTDALRKSPLSTNGLESYSTQALIGELKRRVDILETPKAEVKAEPDEERWIPIDEVAEKYFPGVETRVVATYLSIIGTPYRLNSRLSREDYALCKTFLEKTVKEEAAKFFGHSTQIDETDHCQRMIHPLVGRYHKRKNSPTVMESEPDEV